VAYNLDDFKKMGLPPSETGGFIFNVEKWKLIPPTSKNPDTNMYAHRLNCLGSFYYFISIGLNKNRLYAPLHKAWCENLERPRLKEIIEYPRDHFKSTVHSEAFPIWRTLPFNQEDEDAMRFLGYSDRFIEWMKYAHRQDSSFLLVSETIKNAVKLGTRIRGHYENNQFFRTLFPEIIPDASCVWTNDSLQHKRTPDGAAKGEGTFDFVGVGAALQSRHYDGGIIEDDLVGKNALGSEIEMGKTIEYHQLLVGAMDSVIGYGNQDLDEIVVGNRWAYYDLSSWIRTNEPYFNSRTHSALGGCCKDHPQGIPIFPTEFSIEKLERFRKRLGQYFFSCQFLNEPVNPVDIKFDTKYLRYFKLEPDFSRSEPKLDANGVDTGQRRYKVNIVHQVHGGQVVPDYNPAKLKRYMIVDPNHAGNVSRCRSAITVTAKLEKPRRVYLLDVWAEMSSPEVFIQTIFNMALAWKVTDVYLETIAAQKYLFFHLKHLLETKRKENEFFKRLRFIELKTPKTLNAKAIRIESLGPIFERGEFWVNESGQQEFLEEYKSYPAGKLRDVLDTLGYGPQVWDKSVNEGNQRAIVEQRMQDYKELVGTR
jgi:hypothetical protein